MRALLRSGPLLVTLGIVLAGCNEAGNSHKAAVGPPTQANSAGPTNPAPSGASDQAANSKEQKAKPGGSEYVLTVEGMV